MNTIRIRKQIESETIILPELRPFIGRMVEIVIEETPTETPTPSGFIPGNGDWEAFRRAADSLREQFDYDVQTEQDACDIRDMKEQVK